MAYRALTQGYYIFFGIDKDAIMWNDDGTYKCLNKKKISLFSYISYNEKFEAYGKETNLHNFLWHFIEKFAKEAQKGFTFEDGSSISAFELVEYIAYKDE